MLASVDKGRHARLQRKHALLLRLAHDLSVENIQLRRREKVMISLLAEQVDYLHNLGTITLLSACDGSSSSSAAADKQTAAVVAALAADVEAYQLLQQLQQVQPPSNASSCHAAAAGPARTPQHPISSSSRCTPAAEPLSPQQQQQQQQQEEPEDGGEGAVVTTQRLRAAVAPETVLQVSSAPLEQIVVELREITKRMALLRLAGSGAAAAASAAGEGGAVSGTLEDCVMEYGKLCMRVHMGKNQQSVQLSSINLETMCREQPPPGFWASIAYYIQPSLTTEQVERLAFGFQVYLEKRAPLVSKSQEIVSQLQRRLGYSAAEDGCTTGPNTSQQHSQQQHNSSSDCRASAASNLSAHPEGLGFENADVAVQQIQPDNPLQQQQQEGGGGGNSSSSSGGSQQCARQLEQLLLGDVSSPEQLDSLLQQLSVCTTQLWEVSRHLIFHWVNTLNTEQMAASITMSFPYWVQPVPLCEYVWRQQQEAYADGPCVSACSKV